MAGRGQLASILAKFERDRSTFVWAIADAARHEGNAAPLAALGAPALLLPLLNDPAETVAHTAAFALGRLAGHSPSVAAALTQAGVVGTLITRMKQEGAAAPSAEAPAPTDGSAPASGGDRRHAAKRAAVGMLVSLTRHSSQLTTAVAEQGGLEAAVACLGEVDAEVKEGAAWTLAHVVAHSQELAARACVAGALRPLVACLGPAPSSAVATASGQGADAAVKRVAASALGDISGHSTQLAAQVVEAGAVGTITTLLRQALSNDARLKRQLLCALMHIAKADASLAQAVVDAGAVPEVARCLKFADDTARRHAAACLREIIRHSPALALAVVEAPGNVLESLAVYAASASAAQAMPSLTAFGFAAEHSPELAARVAAAPGALAALTAALQCGDEHSQAAAAWSLGRIGGNAPAAAAQVAATLPRLCTLAASATQGSDLQAKCMRAAGAIVGQASDVAQLAALVMQPGLTPALLELLVERCAAIMAKHPASRTAFATAGALAHLEARQAELPPDSSTSQHIDACLRLFPQELRQHYSPAYAAKLLAALATDPTPVDTAPASHSASPVPQEAAEEGVAKGDAADMPVAASEPREAADDEPEAQAAAAVPEAPSQEAPVAELGTAQETLGAEPQQGEAVAEEAVAAEETHAAADDAGAAAGEQEAAAALAVQGGPEEPAAEVEETNDPLGKQAAEQAAEEPPVPEQAAAPGEADAAGE